MKLKQINPSIVEQIKRVGEKPLAEDWVDNGQDEVLEDAIKTLEKKDKEAIEAQEPAFEASKELAKDTATEKVRLQGTKEPKTPNLKPFTECINVKNRKELAFLITEAKAKGYDFKVARSMEEGFRYDVTISGQRLDEDYNTEFSFWEYNNSISPDNDCISKALALIVLSELENLYEIHLDDPEYYGDSEDWAALSHLTEEDVVGYCRQIGDRIENNDYFWETLNEIVDMYIRDFLDEMVETANKNNPRVPLERRTESLTEEKGDIEVEMEIEDKEEPKEDTLVSRGPAPEEDEVTTAQDDIADPEEIPENSIDVIKDIVDIHGEGDKVTIAAKGELDNEDAPKIEVEVTEEQMDILENEFHDDEPLPLDVDEEGNVIGEIPASEETDEEPVIDFKVFDDVEDEEPVDVEPEDKKEKKEESLNESKLDEAKIISDLGDFKPWGGASDVFARIKEAGKIDALDALIEDMYPNGIGKTELNDLLWFESDWVLSSLGIVGGVEASEDEFDDDDLSDLDFDDEGEDTEVHLPEDEIDDTPSEETETSDDDMIDFSMLDDEEPLDVDENGEVIK